MAPLTTPQMSPITSAQIFATFDAFFISLSDVLAPFAFLVAFAWKCPSSATVTDNPLALDCGAACLIEQNSGLIIYDYNMHEKLRPASVINDTAPDNINVNTKACRAHFMFELSCLLFFSFIFFKTYLA